jgi:hypothetical protein
MRPPEHMPDPAMMTAGAGDAGFGTEMGDGDGGWGHQLSAVLQKFVDGKINIFCNLSEQNR